MAAKRYFIAASVWPVSIGHQKNRLHSPSSQSRQSGRGCLLAWQPEILGETVQGLVHIVDDDASFRTAMERRLKKAGYEVAT
jgi:hypothetical protein